MFKKKSVTATNLWLRIIWGGYLLYLAYTLIPAIQTATDTKKMIFWGVVVTLFIGVGSMVVLFSVKGLIKGEYDKGTDSQESNTEQEVGNNIEEKEDMNDYKEK